MLFTWAGGGRIILTVNPRFAVAVLRGAPQRLQFSRLFVMFGRWGPVPVFLGEALRWGARCSAVLVRTRLSVVGAEVPAVGLGATVAV